MPPVIHESGDEDEREEYSEIDNSSIVQDEDEEERDEDNLEGEEEENNEYGNLGKRTNMYEDDSDLSSVLSVEEDEEVALEGGEEGDEEGDEGDEAGDEEGDVEDGIEVMDEDEEDVGDVSSDIEAPSTSGVQIGDDAAEGEEEVDDEEEDEDEEDDEDDEDDDNLDDDEEEEDNYKLEDPDEIDEDLELKDDEVDDIPKSSPHKPSNDDTKKHPKIKLNLRTKPDSKPITTSPSSTRRAPARESRKRQLTFYEEDEDEDDDDEDDDDEDAVQLHSNKKRTMRLPEPQIQPTDLDADLILTDEEAEYNPHANPDLAKMTERQRARYLEEIDNDNTDSATPDSKKFIELDDAFNKHKRVRPKRKETEEEATLRKAESARKRLDYKMKAMEEEKRDTLNKLLKRRATKTREVDSSDKNKTENGDDDELADNKVALKPRRPVMQHLGLFRWVNNITSLSGDSILGVAGTRPIKTKAEETIN